MEIDDRYRIGKHTLVNIRNKNEVRVISLMTTILSEMTDYDPTQSELEDIYALTLNKLPARYVQVGTIVIRGELTNEEIRQQIQQAIERVRSYPKADRG